jgi:hypothetical protein
VIGQSRDTEKKLLSDRTSDTLFSLQRGNPLLSLLYAAAELSTVNYES